jgi:hypothetical protein
VSLMRPDRRRYSFIDSAPRTVTRYMRPPPASLSIRHLFLPGRHGRARNSVLQDLEGVFARRMLLSETGRTSREGAGSRAISASVDPMASGAFLARLRSGAPKRTGKTLQNEGPCGPLFAPPWWELFPALDTRHHFGFAAGSAQLSDALG